MYSFQRKFHHSTILKMSFMVGYKMAFSAKIKILLLVLIGVAGLTQNAASYPSAQTKDGYYNSLMAMEKEIYLTPVKALVKLKVMSKQLNPLNQQLLALYYLREAQAHNQIMHWAKFSATIKRGYQYIHPNSSNYLKVYYLIYQGLIYQRQGDYKKSRQLLLTAAQKTKSSQNISAYIFSMRELAYTQSLTEHFETALIELQDAYEKAMKSNDLFLEANVEETYGAVFSYMHSHEKALIHLQKAMNLYKKLNYTSHYAEVLLGYGMTQRHAKNWRSAIKNLIEYKNIVANFNSSYADFLANYGLGMTYADKGDFEKAYPYLLKSTQLKGPLDYQAELFKQLAIYYSLHNDASKSFDYLNKAKLIFEKLPDLKNTSWEMETIKVKAKIYNNLGEPKKAYNLLMQYLEKYIGVTQKQSSRRLFQLELNSLNTRKDLEIEMLRKQAALDLQQIETQQQINDKQKLMNFFMSLMFLAIIGFIIWQFYINRKLKRLSNHDGLTGLYNRRFTFEKLTKMLINLNETKGLLTLLLIDLDDFKNINDEYGHPTGDKILKLVAETGLSILRPGDIFARVGGEEFMLILPRTAHEQGINVAERFRCAIENTRLKRKKGPPLSITTSIGTTTFDEYNSTLEQIYSHADQALYAAKQAGKNTIKTWVHKD